VLGTFLEPVWPHLDTEEPDDDALRTRIGKIMDRAINPSQMIPIPISINPPTNWATLSTRASSIFGPIGWVMMYQHVPIAMARHTPNQATEA
jgi:hypothetical protein